MEKYHFGTFDPNLRDLKTNETQETLSVASFLPIPKGYLGRGGEGGRTGEN